jgi:pectinesterase
MIARELKVPFVDAQRITHDLEQQLGVEGSRRLHVWYRRGEHPALPEGRQDNTHYNVFGAHEVARLLSTELAIQVPALAPYIKR